MTEPNFDFDEVEEDSKETETTRSSSKFKQAFVNLEHGTKEFNSEEHDCAYCDDGFDAVVIVDRLGRQEKGLDEVALPSCDDCTEKIEESAHRKHYETRVEPAKEQ